MTSRARGHVGSVVAVLAAVALVAACHREASVVDGGVGGGPGENGGRAGGNGGVGAGAGGRNKRSVPVFVYVDGEPWAAIQKGELPPGFAPAVDAPPEEGEPARRYSLLAYLRALGVDVRKVREVHLHGGRTRIGVLTGAQLRAPPDTQFAFTRNVGGRVVMRWAADAKATDMIDKVNDIAVYVDKPPPVRDANSGAMVLDGVPVDGIAYVTADVQGGTRVYVDGRLAGILRPRDLDGDGPHPLLAQLQRLGVDVRGLVAVDLVDEEVLVRRVRGHDVPALAFSMPTGGGGVADFGVAHASVVLAYRKKTPPPEAKAR